MPESVRRRKEPHRCDELGHSVDIKMLSVLVCLISVFKTEMCRCVMLIPGQKYRFEEVALCL